MCVFSSKYSGNSECNVLNGCLNLPIVFFPENLGVCNNALVELHVKKHMLERLKLLLDCYKKIK